MFEAKIEIKPLGKARPRVTRFTTYMPQPYVDYKAELKRQCLELGFDPDMQYAVMHLDFYFKLPKSLTKKERITRMKGHGYHVQKPDLDNLVGAVMDALLDKDEGIAHIQSSKYWSEDFTGIKIACY